jgi:two-component system chemotaxis response regulator CheB
MKTIKVIIATPSPVDRYRLAKTLATFPWVKILSQASCLSQTYMDIESKEPDLVLMAKEFYGVEEFSCMKSLHYALGARWVRIDEPGAPCPAIWFEDGTLGPEPMVTPNMESASLLRQLNLAMGIRRKRAPLANKGLTPTQSPPQTEKLVLIGASTGGIDALLAVVANFPADCPPTAIVQHTGQGFSQSLIRLLDRRCAARVVAAEDRMALTTGMICVAGHQPGHLRLRDNRGYRCSVVEGPAISGHTPSVDALFQSAISFSTRVIAVLLTGMGRDGAAGLLDLHKAGAITIGQNKATSVVYGMPRVAWEMGAVRYQLGLDKIGPEIMRLATAPCVDPVCAK